MLELRRRAFEGDGEFTYRRTVRGSVAEKYIVEDYTIEGARKHLQRATLTRETPACLELLKVLRRVVPFDCAAVMTTDPETLLPASGIFEGLDPSICEPFWRCEAGAHDVHRFVDLASDADPVAALSNALPQTFEDSPRFREVYSRFPLGDELRVVFRAGGATLGMAAFLRMDPGRTFSQSEQAAMRRLVAPAAALLRREALTLPEDDALVAPAVALVSSRDEIFGRTPGAEAILSDLRGGALGSAELPPTIIAPLARMRGRRASSTLSTRLRGASGRWYRLRVAPVVEQEGVHALSLDPAGPAELMPLLLRAFEFTVRESQVVSRLVRGLSAKELAAEFAISTHTAHDHIKAIYRKAGVRSRGELLARLTGPASAAS
jgi:DNA-binding CsgD family transcriptional regulator